MLPSEIMNAIFAMVQTSHPLVFWREYVTELKKFMPPPHPNEDLYMFTMAHTPKFL